MKEIEFRGKLEPLSIAKSVQIIYKEGRHRFSAIDVSFAVNPKEKFVIIGPSWLWKE